MLELAPQISNMVTKRNDPYGPTDGVTHTLITHGLKHNIANVMLEISSALIQNQKQQTEVAQLLCVLLTRAIKKLTPSASSTVTPPRVARQ